MLDVDEALANGLGNLGQQNGYAGQLAAQAGAPLTFPRILWPGFPNVITVVDLGPPFVLERVTNPPFTLGRLNPFEQATNLAVPGDTAEDALFDVPDATCAPEDVAVNPLSLSNTNCVLGAPGLLEDPPVAQSQVEWAEQLATGAGTIFVLLGTNEALGAILEANPVFLTPVNVFEGNYEEVLQRLAAVSTTQVVATVPDTTLIPFLTSTEEVAELLGLSFAQMQALFGLESGDFVTPFAFAQIQAILGDPTLGPLTPDVVLTAAEADTIRMTIDGYNQVIADAAAEHGAVLVDFAALADDIAENGVVVTGQLLTFDFGGGLFSMDGVHLTNTGYAIVTNEYIKTLNTEVKAGIPPIAVARVRLQDPLVGVFVGRPPVALGVMTSDMVQSLRLLLSE